MASFSRLFGLASRAVDKMTSDSGSPGSAPRGTRDWRGIVRQAADAVTGEGRDGSHTPPRTSHADAGYAPPPAPPAAHGRSASPAAGATATTRDDRAAIARYDYLLKTAAPDDVERMHREAFARLSPSQRAQVKQRMDAELAPAERPRSVSADDLGRAAARAEAMRPGRMSGLLARVGRGGVVGAGVVGVGGLLAVVAGGAVASAVAGPLLAEASRAGIDFVGLAEGVDVEAMASGIDLGAAGEWAGGAQEAVSGAGERLSGWGEQLSDLDVPGLGDLFGR